GALAAIKRLWPTLFAEEVAQAVGQDTAADRFVVSTHTMALARQLENWLSAGAPMSDDLRRILDKAPSVSLPKRLSARFGSDQNFKWAKRIPALLDKAAENGDEADLAPVERLVKEAFEQANRKNAALQSVNSPTRIETYYALLLMDGDHMGKILSG